jgi:hypothetical protein
MPGRVVSFCICFSWRARRPAVPVLADGGGMLACCLMVSAARLSYSLDAGWGGGGLREM